MQINKIRYKNIIDFDYFEIWLTTERDGDFVSIFDNENFELKGKLENRASCVSTQICPWCAKKYGLYPEVERTPESIDEEIEFYKNEDPESFDTICGIDGCNNGNADYVDINWKTDNGEDNFTIIERR